MWGCATAGFYGFSEPSDVQRGVDLLCLARTITDIDVPEADCSSLPEHFRPVHEIAEPKPQSTPDAD